MTAQPRDPRPGAVALAYHESDEAPRVIAKGRGATAEAIIDKARAAGVYVHESPELVSLLLHLDLDTRIPSGLYVAVAELLTWIYLLEQENGAAKWPPETENMGA